MPLSAILAIAGACATASVLVIPPAEPLPAVAATPPASQSLEAERHLTGNLQTAGDQVSSIFTAVEAVAATVSGP